MKNDQNCKTQKRDATTYNTKAYIKYACKKHNKNKPNSPDLQNDTTSATTKDYDQLPCYSGQKNKANAEGTPQVDHNSEPGKHRQALASNTLLQYRALNSVPDYEKQSQCQNRQHTKRIHASTHTMCAKQSQCQRHAPGGLI